MNSVEGAFLAHQQYISTGKLSPNLLRQPVFRAWERSHLLGASPRRIEPIQLERRATEQLLAAHQGLIVMAKPYLRALSKAAGLETHAVMLGDARAIVLDVVGDEQSMQGPASVPDPGSLLDEGACGANGFGTAIAEGGYVDIVGPEHFIEGFSHRSCHGIPLYDSDRQIVGCVSVVLKRPEAGPQLRELLICAARGIEMELMLSRLENDIRHVASTPEMTNALVEKLRQDVIQALAAARINVDLAARVLGRQRSQDVPQLLQLATHSMDVFRRQGSLLQGLVSTKTSNAQMFQLDVLVRDLTSLLETERRLGAIVLDTTGTLEPVSVFADPHETGRSLFRVFLQAFDVARGGGSVNVSVRPTFESYGEVRFNALPAMNSPNLIQRVWSKTVLIALQQRGISLS